jgi:hypothetical protein
MEQSEAPAGGHDEGANDHGAGDAAPDESPSRLTALLDAALGGPCGFQGLLQDGARGVVEQAVDEGRGGGATVSTSSTVNFGSSR